MSWSFCDSGVGAATTLAHIPLGVTTPQSIALSALPPMVLSSSSKQLFQSLAPLLSCQAPVSSQLMCHLHLGFIVSAACNPIPHRLIQRIWNGEFVEMRELLADNISYNQFEDFHVHTSRLCPRVREVPSLSSWVYCFAAYMAVLTPDPQTREMLAYCRLIFREALRHWGNGWLEYDCTL